ncbi:MAG: hypothetical protein R3D33_04105 [Hyphomicrobiaceae bacterium]
MAAIDPIVTGLASAVSFGCADFLGGRATRTLGAAATVAYVQAVAIVFLGALVVATDAQVPRDGDLMLSVAAGLADGVALTALYQGLAIGRISIVAPLAAVVGVVVPALGEMMLSGPQGLPTLGGIALAVLAVLLLGQTGEEDAQAGAGNRRISYMLGAFSGAMFGMTTLSLGLVAPENATGATMVMRTSAVVVAGLIALGALSRVRASRRGLLEGGGAGVLDGLAMLALVTTATQGLIGFAAALNALYAGVTVLLGVVFLKERVSPVQGLGLMVSGFSVVLLASGH